MTKKTRTQFIDDSIEFLEVIGMRYEERLKMIKDVVIASYKEFNIEVREQINDEEGYYEIQNIVKFENEDIFSFSKIEFMNGVKTVLFRPWDLVEDFRKRRNQKYLDEKNNA